MESLLASLLQMPYYQNYAAASGHVHNISKHEDAVEDLVTKHGFKKWQFPKSLPKQKTIYDWMTHPDRAQEMPEMSYISQPCGTHQSPDFLLKPQHGCVIPLECKSTTTNDKPLYNSGGCKPGYIYVLSSQKEDATTLYLGEDIVTTEQQKLIDDHVERARKLDEELNRQLAALDLNGRGISYYTRPMINQAGGSKFTNYFTHANRSVCEQRVRDHVAQLVQDIVVPSVPEPPLIGVQSALTVQDAEEQSKTKATPHN